MSQPVQNISPLPIEEEMTKSFTDYGMMVVVGRALPDARDGLKPVHRRIVYAMHHLGYGPTQPFKKSARIVGDVMGRFHPHGDSAIYESMVRLAQPFSLRVPLVNGQGNFGSIDGDPAAAMRYTEARQSREASLLVEDLVTRTEADLAHETVGFRANYDESTMEPTVLPARFPNLLVNGAEGIAVGMATRIPPHNPVEALEACLAYLANEDITLDELMEIIPGPDFPTAAQIMGSDGIRQAYETGRGPIVLRALHELEEDRKGREKIVFTELPYQVNKADLVAQINGLAKEKVIEGIAEVRDESDRDGIRVVVDLRMDADPHRVLAQLHKHSNVQVTFSFNMMAIADQKPKLMTLKDILRVFLEFRREVIRKRARFQLKKARERGHVLIGLSAALDNIDRVIELVRSAADQEAAIAALVSENLDGSKIGDLIADVEGRAPEGTTFRLSELQAKAILEMRLQRLTGLERSKLVEECTQTAAQIRFCREVLTQPEVLARVLKEELEEAKARLSRPRLTKIMPAASAYREEDLIQRQDVVVTMTMSGYVKWVPLAAFRAQSRGGVGKLGMATKDEDDAISAVIATHTHAPLVVFTERGIAYGLKVYQLPEGTPQSRGRPIINFLNLDKSEKIVRTIVLPTEEEAVGKSLLFVTEKGNIRRNDLEDFASIQSNGKIAMKFEGENGENEDRILDVLVCDEKDEVMLHSRHGMASRFDISQIRIFASRASTGVRGMRLAEDDSIMSAAVVGTDLVGNDLHEADLLNDASVLEERGGEPALLTVSELGFGKRTPLSAYRKTNRGAKGVSDRPNPKRCGPIVSSFVVLPSDEVMIMTAGGTAIRMRASEIRTAGRNSLGVRLIRLKRNDQIVAVVRVIGSDEQIGVDLDEGAGDAG